MSIGNSRAKRAEAYLAKVGAALGLTECGRKWLTMAIDPFNDSLRNHDGFPDGNGTLNLVEQIKETAAVTYGGGNNWDCLIVNFPWVLPQRFGTTASQLSLVAPGPNADLNSNLTNTYFIPNNATTATLGGCQAFISASSNNNWEPDVLGGYSSVTLTPPPGVVAGDYRITNMGFEVQNTTAPLYRQGSVTMFRTPVASRTKAQAGQVASTVSGTSYVSTGNILNIDSWPANSQGAFIAPDSIQHNAEFGVYIPSVMNCLDDVSFAKTDLTIPFIVAGQTNGNAPSESSALNAIPFPQFPNTIPTGTQPAFAGMEWGNFHMAGCLFTGLSPQTTLQLSCKWGIEKFPSQNDGILVPICKEVPDRDSVAISLYSHIIQSMPVGCLFDDNGFGDWITDALSVAKQYISPVLSAIPHPAAQGLKGFIDVGSALTQYERPAGSAKQVVVKQAPNRSNQPQSDSVMVLKAGKGQRPIRGLASNVQGPLLEGQVRRKPRKRGKAKPAKTVLIDPVYGSYTY